MNPSAHTSLDRLSQLEVPAPIRLEHLQPALGTVVHGLDLRNVLSLEHSAFLRKLWLARKVIFFRDQALTEEQHIQLGRYFGDLEVFLGNKDSPNPTKHPELLVMARGANDAQKEAFFHQDIPYSNPPIAGAVALLRACPEYGGDTVFADMGAAYRNMSEWLKRAVVGMKAEHRFDQGIRIYNKTVDQATVDRIMGQYPPTIHPVVQTHPETGEKILYVSLAYTARILDVPSNESFALIKLLSDQNLVPEHQCRFRWAKNSIAVWDNRAVQHYACFDYLGDNRELHRVTILDDRVWPAPVDQRATSHARNDG
jgi:taurine dioxygenase